jgi:hypothetical protein
MTSFKFFYTIRKKQWSSSKETLLMLGDGVIAVTKCGVVESVLTWADFKQSKELKKNDGTKRQRITGIPKLDDANDAGGRGSEQCTLILTEGDSAKALAVSLFKFDV